MQQSMPTCRRSRPAPRRARAGDPPSSETAKFKAQLSVLTHHLKILFRPAGPVANEGSLCGSGEAEGGAAKGGNRHFRSLPVSCRPAPPGVCRWAATCPRMARNRRRRPELRPGCSVLRSGTKWESIPERLAALNGDWIDDRWTDIRARRRTLPRPSLTTDTMVSTHKIERPCPTQEILSLLRRSDSIQTPWTCFFASYLAASPAERPNWPEGRHKRRRKRGAQAAPRLRRCTQPQ